MSDEIRYHLGRTLAAGQSRRSFLRRAGALGLTALLAQGMLQSAAVSATEIAIPQRGGHLKLGLHGGDFSNTLIPGQAAAPVPVFNLRSIGDTLVEVRPDGSLEPRLAQEVSVSADGLAWHLRIRKEVRFHDGRPLTPEDVRATLEWHRNPANGSGALVHLLGIESIVVEGDRVTLYLLQPDFCFGQGLGDVCLTITPAVQKGPVPVFTGGYKVEHDEPGVRHQFQRNLDYWDDSRAHVDQLEVLVINDPLLRAAALTSGQIHVASQLDPATALALGAAPELRIARAAGAELHGFGMQLTASPYDNADLRMALRYAIDREGILNGVLKGQGALANDMPSGPGFEALAPMITQRSYDPDLAQFHYRRSRLDGAPIILRVSDMAFPQAQQAAAIYRASARAAQIPLEVRREDSTHYWSEVWNRQPFSASAFATAPTTALAFAQFRSGAVWNTTRFENPLFDEALTRLRGIADPSARHQAELELASMLHGDGGLISPVRADVLDGHHARVQGFDPSAAGSMMGGFAGTRLWLS